MLFSKDPGHAARIARAHVSHARVAGKRGTRARHDADGGGDRDRVDTVDVLPPSGEHGPTQCVDVALSRDEDVRVVA